MPNTERIIIHPRICVVRTQPVNLRVLSNARQMFLALYDKPHPPVDPREGIRVNLHQNAVLFRRWHIQLPDKKVFLTHDRLGV